jgi:hypothetical protein
MLREKGTREVKVKNGRKDKEKTRDVKHLFSFLLCGSLKNVHKISYRLILNHMKILHFRFLVSYTSQGPSKRKV